MIPTALSSIQARARATRKRIALADAFDERMVLAARQSRDESLADIVLVGASEQIFAAADRARVSVAGIATISPKDQPLLSELARAYHANKPKLSFEEAREALATNDLLFAAVLARAGIVDGVVAGSLSTTGDVIRAALRGIGTQVSMPLISSMFLMCYSAIEGHRDREMTFGFGDCAVVPDPTVEQLADISIATSRTYQDLTGERPVTAMLSFSTKGSASTTDTEKVIAATALARKKAPELTIDGELQFDAAFVPEIGKRKAAGSEVAGRANVFIFPDLDAGNIGYKIAERLGMGEAIGPILQGLDRPMNDLSRGASVSDIVNMIAITAVQSIARS